MSFGPDGLQSFVPRMEKMVRDPFVKFLEGKDKIMVFAIIKQFTFALAADLFFSMTDGPQFWSLELIFSHCHKGLDCHQLIFLALPITMPSYPVIAFFLHWTQLYVRGAR
jgi:cytochrome P450